MSDLIRLVYASRARFAGGEDNAMNADLGRIVMQSRKNNPARGLVGALFFADGCFFQILEGPEAAVEQLYEKLHHDDRHGELKVLRRSSIPQLSFGRWSMKYVPQASQVREVLARFGLTQFDPYSFGAEALDGMIKLLVDRADAVLPGAGDATAAVASASALRHIGKIAYAALGVATLALLIALFK